MVSHCSSLAKKIPWTREPGGLQSLGLQRVRHDLTTEHARATEKEKKPYVKIKPMKHLQPSL